MFAALLSLEPGGQAAELPGLKVLETQKIWPGEPHSAFTDLEQFQGKWYCAFRVGKSHAGKGDHGRIRVIVSNDGKSWRAAALLQTKGVDLRDAKLSVTPGGKLLLNSCEYRVDNDKANVRHNTSVTYLSRSGTDRSAATQIADKGYGLWQTTWRGEYEGISSNLSTKQEAERVVSSPSILGGRRCLNEAP